MISEEESESVANISFNRSDLSLPSASDILRYAERV